MKNVYTWAARPARRTVTVADLRAGKGKRKFTQVTANTAEESAAAAEAGLDMIICNSQNVEDVRAGNDTLFLTAAIGLPDFPTEADILREAFRALALGADAVLTARSMDVVSMMRLSRLRRRGSGEMHCGRRQETAGFALAGIGPGSRLAFETPL